MQKINYKSYENKEEIPILCPSCRQRKLYRKVWVTTDHAKKWQRDYFREYRKRPYVKARAHEYYLRKKVEKYKKYG